VRVAIGKLPGVESVEVSLQRAIADVRLKPGNAITLDRLRQIVKSSGFNAREATVIAVGTLIERGGKPAVNVSGIDTVWLVVPDAAHRPAYDDAVRRATERRSQRIEITGVLPEPKDMGTPEQIAVHTVTISK
jgi:copper chaperone CopZ